MSACIHKSHNVTALLYHLAFPAKYRRVVLDDDVDEVLKEVSLGIEQRYEIKFLENWHGQSPRPFSCAVGNQMQRYEL